MTNLFVDMIFKVGWLLSAIHSKEVEEYLHSIGMQKESYALKKALTEFSQKYLARTGK